MSEYDKTIAEFAAEIGVTRQAVYKAGQEGRIVVKDGRVNSAAARRMWQEMNPAYEQKPLQPAPEAGKVSNEDMAATASASFKNNRAIREKYEANLRRLEYEEKAGKLVPIDKVQREAFNAARTARDRLLSVSTKVVPLLVGKTDIREMTEILDSAIRDALSGLADLFDGITR